jgi:hypothetical protein
MSLFRGPFPKPPRIPLQTRIGCPRSFGWLLIERRPEGKVWELPDGSRQIQPARHNQVQVSRNTPLYRHQGMSHKQSIKDMLYRALQKADAEIRNLGYPHMLNYEQAVQKWQ